MNDAELLIHLRSLEIELHQPAARSDPGRLDALLHDSFVEFGRSGTSYDKAAIMESLAVEENGPRVWSEAYELTRLAEDTALLTYKTAHSDEAGKLSRHTLRSSLWVRTPQRWQVRFHQGTPTASFREHVG